MSDTKRIERISPRKIRRRLGTTQSEFWSRIGVTQSAGSRYECGRSMPAPVKKLLLLVHGNSLAPGNSSGKAPNNVKVKTQLDPRKIRSKLGVSQFEFWSNIGLTQSAGSRYESGRAMPRPVQARLSLVHVEPIRT